MLLPILLIIHIYVNKVLYIKFIIYVPYCIEKVVL